MGQPNGAIKIAEDFNRALSAKVPECPIELIKDLGMRQAGNRKNRFGLFLCPVCSIEFEANVNEMARSSKTTTKCKHK